MSQQPIEAGRAIFASVLCLPAKALAAAGLLSVVLLAPAAQAAENPLAYFRAEDAAAYTRCVNTITNMQSGELYGMTWDKDADYHMDLALSGNSTDAMSSIQWLCARVLNNAPVPEVVGIPGCTAFTATNAVGDRLVGRNFDYKLPMTHVLLFVPKNEKRRYSSVGTVDAGWLGYDVGALDNGTKDLSYAALFPYFCMDGMNEKGFSATILSLEGRPRPGTGEKTWMTEQFEKGRQNIVTTLALRYLLDNAASTQEAVDLLNSFNMFAAIGGNVDIVANYHLYLCDKSGDVRVAEWMPPTKEGDSWKLSVVNNAKAISNFYLSDGYGHGSNRWEIARQALACQNDHLETFDAMNLCRAISQRKGAEQTSWTHWSVVYNLTTLSAEIATLGHYDEIFPYAFKGEDDWELGEKKTQKPEIDTKLPTFPSGTAVPGKVYQMSTLGIGGVIGGAPGSLDGVRVSAVNRMGCTYESRNNPIHDVIRANYGIYHAAFYADMSEQDMLNWPCHVVAGVNAMGLSARIARFAHSFSTGSQSPSVALVTVLTECETAEEAAVAAAFGGNPSIQGAGVIFTDAKGNVATWPAGAEFRVDEASEMVKYSLDLRKGIYEIDGDGRGQFDELPGLMRLASSADTKAIISMDHGHLDVMLPESNVVWRTELKGVNIPVYGVVAEPTAVAHATAVVTYENGKPVEINNQGRIVALTNALMKVTYKAEKDYYFQNGTGSWSAGFRVGATATTPPKPEIEPRQLVEVDYVDENGMMGTANAMILSSSSEQLNLKGGCSYAVTNNVVLSSGITTSIDHAGRTAMIILADGATLNVKGVDNSAGIREIRGDGVLIIYGQQQGTGRLAVHAGRNASGVGATRMCIVGGSLSIAGDAGFPAIDGELYVYDFKAALTVRAGNDRLSQTVLGKSGAYLKEDLAGKRYLTIAPEVPTVTVPVEHASRKIYVDGVEAVQGVVWSNQTATVVYTADEGYVFASGETEMTFALDATKSPAEILNWQDPGALVKAWEETRTLAVDTRERIVIATPEEVLPIAYSTNFWGVHAGSESVAVDVTKELSKELLVGETTINGFTLWKPTAGEFGVYRLVHHCYGMGTQDDGKEIYYSQPYGLTIAADHGSVTATANTLANGTVLGFDFVQLVAEPEDEKWQLAKMTVMTNGVAIALDEPETAITNRFEMPCCDTVVTGVFTVSASYIAAATNELTAAYRNDIAYLESILTGADLTAAKDDVKQTYDDGVAAIRAALTPTDVDTAKASALEAVAEATLRHSKFAITYYAMGGVQADGVETNVVDAYVNKGYEFPAKDPTRDNFTFDGWFRTWSNRNEQVTALDTAVSPVQPLAAHSLYAQWTPVSTKPSDKHIAIPDTTNDVPVLTIESFAYAQASHPSQAFETLVTPLYLQSIGKGAFQGVTTLKTLIITPARSFDDPRVPVALEIGQQAFASCTALEEIRIPGEVTSIGNSAFQNCAKLKRILFTGTSAVTYGSMAFYRCGYDNGAGELKVYMTKDFSDNNAALVSALATWNTTLKVVPLVGISPASGASPTITQTDFGTLGVDRKVALLVKVPTLIPGTKPDVSSVVVKHSTDLATWNMLVPDAATAAEDGTVLVEFTMPKGSAGYVKVEIR